MPKPEEKKPEDFATRLGRHLLTEADPTTITEPKKPEGAKPAETTKPQGEESAPEPVGHGLAIGDLVAGGAKKKEEKKPEGETTEKKEEKPAAETTEKKQEEKKPAAQVKLERKETAPKHVEEKKPEAAPAEKEEPTEKSLDELVGVKLTDDEREYLELVRYAEGKDTKLKGSLDREVQRLKAFAEFARKWRKDHPGQPIDPNDEDYKAIAAEHPATLSKADVKRLDREKLRDEITTESARALTEREEKLERRMREVEVAPRVEQQLKADEVAFSEHIADDDLKGVLEKKGIEGRAAREFRTSAMSHVKAYRRISEGLEDYNKDDPVHRNVIALMDAAGDYFKKNGGPNGQADLTRDGRRFVSRREYAALERQESPDLAKIWTFSHDDVVSIILGNHAGALRKEITELRTGLAEDGYSRQSPPNGGEKKTEEAKPAAAEERSPRSGPSPSVGGGAQPKEKAPVLSRFEKFVVGDPNGA